VAGYARKKATQKAVRAKKLDSLLIDEGFGTLDPKALDAAARRY
jgi:DNA repair exonuclease SbcCD ATPase subunit